MANINEQLQALYESKKGGLGEIEEAVADAIDNGEMKNDDYSFPLLMYCWEKEYLASNKKLLFIGQETNTWWADADKGSFWADNMISATTGYYKEFALGKNLSSPFWQAVNKINSAVNPNMEFNFLWTNIFKFGRKDDKGHPCKVVQELELENFNVLASEIEIISPDVVIFFTGNGCDINISERLGETKFEKCSDHETEIFARVVNKNLPKKSFRTYHPSYLRRDPNNRNLWNLLDTLIELIQ